MTHTAARGTMRAVEIALFIVFGSVMLGVALFNQKARWRRASTNTPIVSIEAFPEGKLGKVVGALEYVAEPIFAPLTDRECAYYEAVVEQSDGDNGWKNIVRERRGVTFSFVDSSGRALVDPTRAEVVLVQNSRTKSGSFDPAAVAEEEAFLSRHGNTVRAGCSTRHFATLRAS